MGEENWKFVGPTGRCLQSHTETLSVYAKDVSVQVHGDGGKIEGVEITYTWVDMGNNLSQKTLTLIEIDLASIASAFNGAKFEDAMKLIFSLQERQSLQCEPGFRAAAFKNEVQLL